MTSPKFLPGARIDLLDAIDYYAGTSRKLALDFLTEVVRNLDLIKEFPEAAAIARGEVRKKVLRRFPYGLLYFLESEKPVIVAVMHQNRRPDYWHHRVE